MASVMEMKVVPRGLVRIGSSTDFCREWLIWLTE